jgi:hypothetical protein
MEKKIKAVLDFNTNYLWHLWNLGNLWDRPDKEYHDLYAFTISEADRDFLYKNRDLLAWGNGRSGVLTYNFFFLALKEERNKSEFTGFFQKEKRDLINLKSDDLDDEYKWFISRKPDAMEIIDIIIRNIDHYEYEVWPQIKDKMTEPYNQLNQYFTENEILSPIENRLGRNLPFEEMTLLLSYANRIYPSANDISNCRWNYYYNQNQKDLIAMIKHELIINVFKEEYSSLYQDEELSDLKIRQENLLWQANESFAEYLKSVIFGEYEIWNNEMFGGGRIRMQEFFEFFSEELKGEIMNLRYCEIVKKAVKHRLTL